MDDFFRYDPQVSGCKGLVYVGGKIIVYRRDGNTTQYPHMLDLPGGGVENHESPFETFVREIREEFGLTITREQLVHAHKYDSTFDLGKTGYFVVVKLPAAAERDIVFGNEGSEYWLMSVNDYLSRSDAIEVFQQRTREYARALPLYSKLIADEAAVAARIAELAVEIVERYQGQDPLFVCLLRGGAPFAVNLMQAIAKLDPHFHPVLDYMTIKTYGDERTDKAPQLVARFISINRSGKAPGNYLGRHARQGRDRQIC